MNLGLEREARAPPNGGPRDQGRDLGQKKKTQRKKKQTRQKHDIPDKTKNDKRDKKKTWGQKKKGTEQKGFLLCVRFFGPER